MKPSWTRFALCRSSVTVVLGATLVLGCGTKGSSKKRLDATTSADDTAIATDGTDGQTGDGSTDAEDLDVVTLPDVALTDTQTGTDGQDVPTLPDTSGGEDVPAAIDIADPPPLDITAPDTSVVDIGADVGTGDPCTDGAVPATVYDINKGDVGDGIKVTLTKLIATSPKILISHSKSTGSCLWGVFASAGTGDGTATPLSVAAPYSGLLTVAFGDIALGDVPCPVDTDPLPAGIAPGDEFNVVGSTQTFVLNNCASQPNPPEKGMKQVSQVCASSLTGFKRPVPAAAVLTDEAQYLSTASGSVAQGVHDRWQGTRVRVNNVAADVSSGGVVGPYGVVTLTPGAVNVVDKLYYGKNPVAVCASAPVYASAALTFDFIEGFHYLDFCTWAVAPLDKCADYSPASDDCLSTGTSACLP